MPSEVRFAVVRRRLEQNGWTLNRTKGSHHVFTQEGQRLFSIPVHKKRVRAVYLREINAEIARLDQEDQG